MEQTTPQPASPTPAKKDPLTFDRSDRWGLAILLAVVAVATIAIQVVQPVLQWVAGEPRPIELVTEVSVPDVDLPIVDGAGLVEVLLPAPSAGLRLLDLLAGVLVAAMVVIGCWLILRLMRTVAAGDPFHPANVRRLRIIGGFLVLGVPIVYFLESAVSGSMLAQAPLDGVMASVWLDVPWQECVSGMVVALLAEAFKGGSRLRDDVEGLV